MQESNEYKKLWAAVLAQAIEDLSIGEYNLKNGKGLSDAHQLIRNDAKVWINSKNDCFNSFIGVCDILEICPMKTRAKINSLQA